MFGVTPKDYAIGKEHWLTSKLDVLSSIDYTLQTVDLPSDEVSELITVPELLQLIQNAINITHMSNSLQKLTGKSPAFNMKFLPFTSSVCSIFFNK